jgi:hypothetical protein
MKCPECKITINPITYYCYACGGYYIPISLEHLLTPGLKAQLEREREKQRKLEPFVEKCCTELLDPEELH